MQIFSKFFFQNYQAVAGGNESFSNFFVADNGVDLVVLQHFKLLQIVTGGNHLGSFNFTGGSIADGSVTGSNGLAVEVS